MYFTFCSATIVKDLLVYQENVSALMSCIPDDDDDEEESTSKFAAATNVPDNSKFIQSKLLKALFA